MTLPRTTLLSTLSALLLAAVTLCGAGCGRPAPGDLSWLLGSWYVTPAHVEHGVTEVRFGAGGRGMTTNSINQADDDSSSMAYTIQRRVLDGNPNSNESNVWMLSIQHFQPDGETAPAHVATMSDMTDSSFTTTDANGLKLHYTRVDIKSNSAAVDDAQDTDAPADT